MEEHIQREMTGAGGKKINIDQAERQNGLIQRERMENKEGGVEYVSREWIKYVCLNKPTTRVTRLKEGRDKEKRKEEHIYIKKLS